MYSLNFIVSTADSIRGCRRYNQISAVLSGDFSCCIFFADSAVYVWGAIPIEITSSDKLPHDVEAAQQQQKENDCAHSTHVATQTGTTTASTATQPQPPSCCSTGNGTVAMCCQPRRLALPTPGITIRRVAAGWQHMLFLAGRPLRDCHEHVGILVRHCRKPKPTPWPRHLVLQMLSCITSTWVVQVTAGGLPQLHGPAVETHV